MLSSARNQTVRLNTSNFLKTSENFPWFPDFQICSIAKNENPEISEINKKLSKQKSTHCLRLLLLENW